jgi:hypothetical protein
MKKLKDQKRDLDSEHRELEEEETKLKRKIDKTRETLAHYHNETVKEAYRNSELEET